MNFKQHVKRIANNGSICWMSIFVIALLALVPIVGMLYTVNPPNYNTDYPEYQHRD